MEYETHISSMIVKPKSEPIFSEKATTIRIEDEAAGCYVVIEQQGEEVTGKIRVDRVEWGLIRDAVGKLFIVCDQINNDCGVDL